MSKTMKPGRESRPTLFESLTTDVAMRLDEDYPAWRIIEDLNIGKRGFADLRDEELELAIEYFDKRSYASSIDFSKMSDEELERYSNGEGELR